MTKPHIIKMDVSEAVEGSTYHSRFTGNKVTREECHLLNLDGVPVKGEIKVTIDTEDGIPGNVYVAGSHPLYETFVFRDKTLVAHDPGLLAHKS